MLKKKTTVISLFVIFGALAIITFENFTATPGSSSPPANLPPVPLITSQQAALQNEFMNSVTKNAWNWNKHSTQFPVESQGLLHAGNSTNDLRVQTENCDQIGGSVATGYPDGQTGVCIYTISPEAVATPLAQSDIMPISRPVADPSLPTTTTEVGLYGTDFIMSPSGASPNLLRGSRFICDVNNLSEPANAQTAQYKNPFPCNVNGGTTGTLIDDCYDVNLMGVLQTEVSGKYDIALTGRRIEIIVANPKTASAQVSSVVFLSNPVQGPTIYTMPVSGFVSTPSISGDGKLLILPTPNGIEYSYSTTPCDITGTSGVAGSGWLKFNPITNMYLDSNVNSTYGIARFPIRDSENNILKPSGSYYGIYGNYLWMDTNATMLFYNSTVGNAAYFFDTSTGKAVQRYSVATIGAELLDCNNTTTYPTEAKAQACFQSITPSVFSIKPFSSEQSMAFFGLWTNGKLIKPDSKLNKNSLGILENTSQSVQLYSTGTTGSSTAASPWKLISSDIRRKGGFQNAFNFLPNIRPNSPQDVVWQVSTNEDADEFAFDDYLHTDSFIISPMNASFSEVCLSGGHCFGQVNDGFMPSDLYLDGTAVASHIQNVATSVPPQMAGDLPTSSAGFVKWNIPSYGVLSDSTGPLGPNAGRIEPLAAGGVRGAGIYLNGNNFVSYAIPATQTNDMASTPWFYSVWVDYRGGAGSLISFSDGSLLSVSDNQHLVLQNSSGKSGTFTLPFPMGNSTWTHIALAVTTTNFYSLYINGFHWADLSLASGTTALVPAPSGTIYLGSGPIGATGLMAWVDDFKLMSRIPTVEEICRHAYGTLTGVSSSDGTVYSSYANLYPASSHQEISSLLTKGSNYSDFICETNIVPTYLSALLGGKLTNDDSTYCINNIRRPLDQPNPKRCVGTSIVFPEGPITVNVPRPVSTSNQFCLSCHLTTHPFQALTPSILVPSTAPDTVPASWIYANTNLLLSQYDTIRRPLEEPQWETGVTPAQLYCSTPPTPATTSTTLIPTDVEVNMCGD